MMLKTFKKCRNIVCGLLLIVLFFGSGLNAAETGSSLPFQSADQASNLQSIDLPDLQISFKTLLALSKAGPQTFKKPVSKRGKLSLTDLIRRVVADNQQIQMQKTDWMISQTEADQSRAIFEPELITSLERNVHIQRNSIEESLSRNFATTYTERNWNYDAALQTLAPTGGKLKLGYNFNKLSNSLTSSLTNEENEYQMSLGFNLTQPLLKNAGPKVTKAGIKSADLESLAAFQEYRLKMMQRVSKVSIDYWDYYQAYKKLVLRNDSHRIAEQILADNQERHRTGKMAETEVLEAIIGVSTRRSLLSETEHEQVEIANRLRSLLSLTGSSTDFINNPTPDTSSRIKRITSANSQKVSHNQLADNKSPNTKELATIPAIIKRIEIKEVFDNSMGEMFGYGKSELSPSLATKLAELAERLKSKKNLVIKVIGHTDTHQLAGENEKIYGDNFGLGRSRANITVKYLAAQLNLKKSQYKAGTGGPFEPVADNDTAEGRAKNRRVEIFITYDQPVPVKKRIVVKSIPAPVVSPAAVSSRTKQLLNLEVSEPESFTQVGLNSNEIVEKAFKLRPEYLAARKKLQQAKVKISFAKNQRWPELNLLASYGLNGLDFNTGDSWEQVQNGEYSSWSAGLELRLPLQGGNESRSRLKRSELEKRRQLMVLKDIEIELKNRIDTAIDNVVRATEQLRYAEQIIDIQKRLFDTELVRLQAGQSSSRLVLEKEDNYRSARETALVNTVKRQRALVEMELASGTILQKYGVDIMETEY